MALKTIQSNLKQNQKDFNRFSYFLGGIDVTQQNLDGFDPYIQGTARIFMYTPPFFMSQGFPTQTRVVKSMIETGYTRVDGIADISVEFVEFEGGFNGQKFANVSMVHDDTDTFTITLYEQSGSPVREFLDTWVTGTGDPRSGVPHYHGIMLQHGEVYPDAKANNADGAQVSKVPYGEKYHTAEFIYYTLTPNFQDLEYVCMLAHCFPTKVPKSHLNYEAGVRDKVAIDIEMRTSKYESTYINQIGEWYRQVDKIKFSYLDFTPGITQDDVNAAYHLQLADSANSGLAGGNIGGTSGGVGAGGSVSTGGFATGI